MERLIRCQIYKSQLFLFKQGLTIGCARLVLQSLSLSLMGLSLGALLRYLCLLNLVGDSRVGHSDRHDDGDDHSVEAEDFSENHDEDNGNEDVLVHSIVTNGILADKSNSVA